MLYICLPAYNEERALPSLLERTRRALVRGHYEYQVIVYDDGSTDGTVETARKFTNAMPLEVIEGNVNMGLTQGMRRLIGAVLDKSMNDEDVAVFLDADDTHNPEQIPQMLEKIYHGFDIVIASRFCKDSRTLGVSARRSVFSLGACLLMKLVFPIKGVMDYTCGFRAYRVSTLRELVEKYRDRLFESSEFACTAELLIKVRTMRILAVEVPMVLRYDRKQGTSKMKVGRNIMMTLSMIFHLKFGSAHNRKDHGLGSKRLNM